MHNFKALAHEKQEDFRIYQGIPNVQLFDFTTPKESKNSGCWSDFRIEKIVASSSQAEKFDTLSVGPRSNTTLQARNLHLSKEIN